jgi:hypothetical protein
MSSMDIDIQRSDPDAEASQKQKSSSEDSIDFTADAIPTSDELKSTRVIDAVKPVAITPKAPTPSPRPVISKPIKGSFFKHKKVLIIATVVVLLASGGVTYALTRPKTSTSPKPVAKVNTITKTKAAPEIPATSSTVASTLSGLPVAPSVNNNPVTGIMIENTTFARPQAGLSQASVVFEAIAEAGITRFLALFQDTAPANVGPIRSVRPYYETWALGFNASIAHVGGSPEALADIKTWNVRDLDQFYNGSYYHRITTRAAPHNVYTSIALLNQLEQSKGYGTSTFTGFARKAEAPSKTPTATTINFTISSVTYNVSYVYDASTNSYNRSEGGAPQIDSNTNTQISPKVVIALVMPYSLESDNYHSVYGTIGSGPVDIFQDGTLSTGTWSKASNTAQIIFKTAAGKVIPLNPGQTWLTALGSASDISYSK